MNNQVLAKVNGKEITQDMLNGVMRNLPENHRAQMSTEEGQKRLLEEIVSGELLYLEAVDNNLDKTEGFKNLMEEARRNLLQRYAVENLIADVTITEDEIKTFYSQNEDQFATGAEVTASHILVETEGEIKQAMEEISKGLSFEDAAKKYSTCPSNANGGQLGTFSRGKMVPEFEDVAFSLSEGETSEPVKTQFGYHLVKVDAKKESGVASFEEVKTSIESQLLNQKQFDLYNQKVTELKETYPVEIL